MTRFVVLLRAVNVGGGTTIRMETLRRAVGELGFENVRTVLQSGNLVLDARTGSASQVERTLEAGVGGEVGRGIECFARSAADWRAILSENPFPEEARRDPAHLVVTLLKEVPAPAAWSRLRAAIRGRERFEERERHAYFVYPDGIGRSRLTPALIEQNLGVRVTARNWNTARRLESLLRE